ncbi:Kae1-associated kinase Bud32 [Acidilobus sp.]|uniref:Kae1-associated kinase Bud32 n=1 Tax=Acidilobus sp. TaxID=1872109 RepID=UPI003D028787
MVWEASMIGSWASSLTLLKRGAESEVRLGDFMGMKAIYKLRVSKPYMDPALDSRLRAQRTLKEAKVLSVALARGVRVPRLYAVFPSLGLIVMEYVRGPTLKDLVGSPGWESLAEDAGLQLGLLHSAGIVHGDSTTSNMVVSDGGVTLIDFGLADFSSELEDRAVDVHLLREAVTSTHPSAAGRFMEAFMRGYSRAVGEREAEEVSRRAREVEMRGRYVASRRSVWAGEGGEG